ncbi:hypothetical protein [Sphingobacterium griseoflavum]|uniref:S1 motif domain-containing protein n=1 Tax=Sphingobacterium griseoflavum TaxID=1474952 RepID=A0ABQ3HYI6_9SPHI|nr:hypothetical protein [Sphingobacterium griseoflavum]GHE37040.1 hypothetical protein GCM10017764_20320 [Sphingobacterium griseoflavum]
MIGFEIAIGSAQKVLNVATDNTLIVVLDPGESSEESSLSVVGSDSSFNYINWPDQKLKIGDKIRIKIAKIENVSPPAASNPKERAVLLESYNRLKVKLKKKGLL